MLRHKTIIKSKMTFLILLSVGLVLATVGVFLRPVHAQTWVGGPILTDTAWTIVDSPYVVIETVTVYPNATLTIEPGVEVRFGDGFSLVVNGNLSAVGTSGNPIVFTSNRMEPNPPFPGAWGGITFSGTENTSFNLVNCEVTFATTGVRLTNSGKATVQFSEVSNCSQNGLDINQNVVTSWTARIHDNKFFYNLASGFGVYGNYGNINNFTTRGNSVFGNSLYGMQIDPPYSGSTNILLTENNFYDNGREGLYVQTGDIQNFTISKNSIFRNGWSSKYGYYSGLYVSQPANITKNKVFDNYGDGIYAWSEGVRITGNVISANDDYGINSYGKNIIFNNSIMYNDYGVCSRYSDEVHYNDIYFNQQYGAYRAGGTCNATYNYWGDATGPYHMSLNPMGGGNEVNGDGINLRFIPFLSSPAGTINERPIAHLEVSPTQPLLNQTVTFDASLSDDDGRVDYYFFDFGDGTNTGWTTLSVVFHEYSQEDIYNSTLVVKDDFGITSLDGDLVYMDITVVAEFPASLMLPFFMILTLVAVTMRKRSARRPKYKKC